jgi:hypothetical protein
MSADSATSNDPREFDEFVAHLNELFQQVDDEAIARHKEGAEVYGALKFLGADTLQEALEEVLDLINYARYTAVKIKLMQSFLAQQAAAVPESETTGAGTFISTSELLKKGFQPE